MNEPRIKVGTKIKTSDGKILFTIVKINRETVEVELDNKRRTSYTLQQMNEIIEIQPITERTR